MTEGTCVRLPESMNFSSNAIKADRCLKTMKKESEELRSENGTSASGRTNVLISFGLNIRTSAAPFFLHLSS